MSLHVLQAFGLSKKIRESMGCIVGIGQAGWLVGLASYLLQGGPTMYNGALFFLRFGARDPRFVCLLMH